MKLRINESSHPEFKINPGSFHIHLEAETLQEAAFLIRLTRDGVKKEVTLYTRVGQNGIISGDLRVGKRKVGTRSYLSLGDPS